LRTLKLTLEYDGTDFVGWQRQAEGVSIQGLLEEGLARFEGAPVVVHGAGRTDAGVHAVGQVASVTLTVAHDPPAIQRGLNANLPSAVRVLSIEEAAPDFHARFSARSKIYEYRIWNAPFISAFHHRYAWHIPAPLDWDAMRTASACLKGSHDFAAFRSAGTDVPSTERTILAFEVGSDPATPGSDLDFFTGRKSQDLAPPRKNQDLTPGGQHLTTLRIEGDGFLRHMVRNIVGTLVEVGLGRWAPTRVAEILASRDRSQAGPPAPAQGLFLKAIRY
jgi:tRNA pseudouridine38-40 synthase